MAQNLVVSRYAKAIFTLAREQNKIDKVAQDLQALSASIEESSDLASFVHAPLVDRNVAANVLRALAEKGKADPVTADFLCLLAQKRRLDLVQDITRALVDMIDADKGNLTASVTVAAPLDQSQLDALAASLKKMVGAAVRMKMIVDPSILGGLIVQIGSKMMDNSVRRRLERLEMLMKGTV